MTNADVEAMCAKFEGEAPYLESDGFPAIAALLRQAAAMLRSLQGDVCHELRQRLLAEAERDKLQAKLNHLLAYHHYEPDEVIYHEPGLGLNKGDY